MSQPPANAVSPRPPAGSRWRLRLVLGALLALGLGAVSAWGWSAYQTSLARADADAGRLDSAWRRLGRARMTWPAGAQSRLLAARVARRMGNKDEARAQLDAHERAGGDRAARELERTMLLVQQGELEGRDAELIELVQSGHPAAGDALEALARGYLATRHAAGLSRLVELWPDRLVTTQWRGRVHYSLGNYAEAVADLSPFVAQHPDDDEVRLELARACYQSGHSGEALAHWQQLRRRDPTSVEMLLGLAACLQDQSRFDEAAAALDEVLAQQPGNAAALAERARVAYRQGQSAAAERWARRAVSANPLGADGHLVLGFALEAQGKAAEGRAEQQRWQALEAAGYHLRIILPQLGGSPDDADLHYQAGSALLLLGNEVMGKQALEHALRVEPRHRASHKALADYYAARGDSERAAEHRRFLEQR